MTTTIFMCVMCMPSILDELSEGISIVENDGWCSRVCDRHSTPIGKTHSFDVSIIKYIQAYELRRYIKMTNDSRRSLIARIELLCRDRKF